MLRILLLLPSEFDSGASAHTLPTSEQVMVLVALT